MCGSRRGRCTRCRTRPRSARERTTCGPSIPAARGCRGFRRTSAQLRHNFGSCSGELRESLHARPKALRLHFRTTSEVVPYQRQSPMKRGRIRSRRRTSALLLKLFRTTPALLPQNFRLTHARAKRLTAYGQGKRGGAGGRGAEAAGEGVAAGARRRGAVDGAARGVRRRHQAGEAMSEGCGRCERTPGWEPVEVEGHTRLRRCGCWTAAHAAPPSVPREFQDARWSTWRKTADNRHALEEARAFLRAGDGGRDLLLCGPVGTGKTRLACTVLNEAWKSGRAVAGVRARADAALPAAAARRGGGHHRDV